MAKHLKRRLGEAETREYDAQVRKTVETRRCAPLLRTRMFRAGPLCNDDCCRFLVLRDCGAIVSKGVEPALQGFARGRIEGDIGWLNT